jgi:hypothetical protein
MKFELTIKADYLPTWGTYEGLRELLQNGQDAQTEFSAPLTVKHRKDTSTLVIENEGCVLPHESLLLGHTSKSDRADLIGKFGEGLKLGLLALVREGHALKIRSGGEVWVPTIQRSEKFQADVLTFDIWKGREPKQRVAIEVGGIEEEEWLSMKDKFLFLVTLSDNERVTTHSGSLLLGDRFSGKLYVKGIFVADDAKLKYGYDLTDADLDRDRKMIEKYSLQYKTNSIWREAAATRPDLIGNFKKLLSQEAADVEGVDDYNVRYIADDIKKAVANEFLTQHGDDALPVSTFGESQELAHLGRKGVIVPRSLRVVLEQTLGSVETNKYKLREEVKVRHAWDDLDIYEGLHIQRAIEMVACIETLDMHDIEVVDFGDKGIRGMYKTDEKGNKRILLSREILKDRDLTLRVLIHEMSHRSGLDGEKNHVARIEAVWSAIVANMSAPLPAVHTPFLNLPDDSPAPTPPPASDDELS